LISKNDIDKTDIQKIHLVYDDWPRIAREYYEKDLKKINYESIDHIVFAGMGGSGVLSDIFSAILSKTNIHVCVVKGYHIPRTVNSKTLIVTVSISGNTDETLSILESASKQGCKIVAFSSGGKMEQFCLERGINFRKIEQFHSPRASLTSFLYGMLNVLSPILPIKKEEVLESIENLENLKKEIFSGNLSDNNPALSLAKWITNIPLIYYPWGLQAAAIRFKNSLQENSKIHVIVEDILESCHNGIVAWEKESNVQPILIRGVDDHVKTKEKFQILKRYFDENNIKYKEIFSIEGDILSKIIQLIYFLDFASIYKAILEKTDPSPVRSIDYIKDRIGSL
jgi:glucose/mannose-6-phosphate isomerase